MKTTDQVIQATFLGEDDKKYLEQKRQNRKRIEPPAPYGDCCGNCRWWSTRSLRRGYGSCGLLSIVTKHEPGVAAKGEVLANEKTVQFSQGESEPLHTTAGLAACSLYEAGIDRRVAA